VEDSPISSLGYLTVYSDQKDAWRMFATDVLGMSAESNDRGDLLLRMDDQVARFIISAPPAGGYSSEAKHPVVVGWECPGQPEWQRAAQALERAGVAVSPLPEREWYTEAFSCVDPSGTQCELFYGATVDPATHFVSPTGVSFVTGKQGLGHVTIGTPKCRESAEFYHEILGFQIRETKIGGPERGWRWAFLSPNSREHSVAVIDTGAVERLLHVLVEVSDLDSVGRAMDKCVDGHAPMSVSLGRHWNDEMVSFYVRTPSGFDIEYGHGGRSVDFGQWSRRAQGGSGAVSLWGHRVVRSDGTLGPQIGGGH